MDGSGPQIGRVVGDAYELVAPVGRGGTGEVWRATGVTGMPVAVKFLRSVDDPRLDALLRREIRHTAMLSHPHVVDILDEGISGAHRFVVLEWMAGGTLGQRAPSMSLDEVLDALRAVLTALAHAHGRGLLHLDVKPDNVLCATVPPDWRLLDFGIARHIDSGRRSGAGTPLYMAPEQQGGHRLGPAADLYAVGATAWELFTGAPPYEAASIDELLALHRDGGRRTWAPRLPVGDALRRWVERLLEVDPGDRPRSAMAALGALEEAVGRPRPVPSPEPRAVLHHRRPLMATRSPSVALHTLRDVPFLTGRDTVCQLLWQRLTELSGPDVVVLDGAPGVGRTRLGRWLAEAAAEADVARVVRADGTLRSSLEADDDAVLARVLRDEGRPLLWVSDGPLSERDLAVVRDVGAPVLVVQSDGEPPWSAHTIVAVPPLDDGAIRRLLIGLLSLREAAIEAIVPVVSGSLGTLLRLLEHLDARGRLTQDGFRAGIDGDVSWPAAWTDGGLAHLVALRGELDDEQVQQLSVFLASPPRFRVRDLVSLCSVRGLPAPVALLETLQLQGVVWRAGERVWWCDPLLSARCQQAALPDNLGMWGDVEVVRGHPLSAARRFLAAGVSDSAVRLLGRRVDELCREGQVWSLRRFEVALAELVDRGVVVPPLLHARSIASTLLQRIDEEPTEVLQARLDEHMLTFRSLSPVDSGCARIQAAILARADLAAAEDLLRQTLSSPWTDPAAFIDQASFLGQVVLARGNDPTDELIDLRDQLDPALRGPRAWLDVRVAAALIAAGRPADAADRMAIYLHAEGTDWAPAAANMLAEALRLSGQPEASIPIYFRAARGFLKAGLFAWAAAAVNLGSAMGMAGRTADALHLLTALGRRGAVAGWLVLDTCRVAHVAACYTRAGDAANAAEALDGYERLAARHEAVDPEQSVALQLVRQHAHAHRLDPLRERADALLAAMPHVVTDTWSMPSRR